MLNNFDFASSSMKCYNAARMFMYGVIVYISKVILCCFLGFTGVVDSTVTKTAVNGTIHSNDEASAFIDDFANKILGIINKQNTTYSQIITALRPVVIESFDVDSIAKFAMGTYYRVLTAEEKVKFKQSFINMLLRFYLSALLKYKNAKFRVIQVKKISNKHNVVNSSLILDGKTYKLDCSVFMVNNKWKILDVSMDSLTMGPVQKAAIEGKIKAERESLNNKKAGIGLIRAALKSFLKKFNEEYSDQKILNSTANNNSTENTIKQSATAS